MGQTMNQQMEIEGQPDFAEKLNSNLAASSEIDREKLCSNDKEERTVKHKIFSRNIETFCNQLEVFVSEAQLFRKNIAGYPTALQERLNNDIKNLEFLFIETQETVRNIQRIKTQHKFIKKDTENTKKLLKKFKQEEIQEIEDKISKYDTNMYKIWESLKRSTNNEKVEHFLIDLQEKVTALEQFKELVSKKLAEIQETSQAIVQFHPLGIKPKEKPLKSLTYEARKLARPLRGGKKRKQSDRNDVLVTIQDKVPPPSPQLPPLPMNSIALALNETGLDYSISESTGITVSSQSLTNTLASSAYGTESMTRDDMQSVFDALFGTLKRENDTRYEDMVQGGQPNVTNSALHFDFFDEDPSNHV